MSEELFLATINNIIYYNIAELEEADCYADAEWMALLVATLFRRFYADIEITSVMQEILLDRCRQFC